MGLIGVKAFDTTNVWLNDLTDELGRRRFEMRRG